MERRDSRHLLDKSKEIHPRYKDGVCWIKKGEREK